MNKSTFTLNFTRRCDAAGWSQVILTTFGALTFSLSFSGHVMLSTVIVAVLLSYILKNATSRYTAESKLAALCLGLLLLGLMRLWPDHQYIEAVTDGFWTILCACYIGLEFGPLVPLKPRS